MNDALSEMAARPRRYENVDGTIEIAFGWMMVALLSAGLMTDVVMNRTGIARGWTLLLMLIVLLPFVITGRLFTSAIKKHFTFPRTGYALPRRIAGEERWKPISRFILICVSSGLIAFAVVRILRFHVSTIRILGTFLYVVPYAMVALKSGGYHEWKRWAIVGMVVGLIAISAVVESGAMWIAVLSFCALVWLASGFTTLVLYVRHTTPVDGEE